MNNKNVLVTGGTGFVGTWMKATEPENLTVWYSSHKDYDDPIYYWERGHWDYIVHLSPISPDRVIDYAQHHRIKVLHASTGAVYEGKGEYAENKRKWEARCKESNANIVIARLFATSGLPFQKNKALSIFVQNALKGEPLEIWGDGSTVRSYLYGFDVGTWFWKLLLEGEGIYDVGSAIPHTIQHVAQIINGIIPCKSKFIQHEEMPTPTNYLPTLQINYSWNLGCKETVDLKTAIQNMIKGV